MMYQLRKRTYITPPSTPNSGNVASSTNQTKSSDRTSVATSLDSTFDPLAGYTHRPPTPPSSGQDRSSTRGARPSSNRRMRSDGGKERSSSASGAPPPPPPTTTTSSQMDPPGVRVEAVKGKVKREPPKHPDFYATHEDWQTRHEEEKSDLWFQVPIGLVVAPTLLSLVHGRAEHWTDAIFLLLIVFYLYHLVKVPWDVYNASKTRQVLPRSVTGESPLGDEDEDPLVIRQRQSSAAVLRRNELFSLLSTILVPAVGAYALRYVRFLLSDPDRYINEQAISLFTLATGVRPFFHLMKLLKNHSLYHQELVHYPSTEVHRLRQRVEKLEGDLVQLSRAFATKSDVRALRDGVDAPLSALSKAVKRFNRKEEYLRLTSEERFTLLSQRLDETIEIAERQQSALEEMERDRKRLREIDFANFLGRMLGHVLGSGTGSTDTYSSSSSSSTSKGGGGGGGKRGSSLKKKKEQLGWYERGLTWYIFWPVNLPKKAVGWATDTASKTIKGVEEGFVEEVKVEHGGLKGDKPTTTTNTRRKNTLKA